MDVGKHLARTFEKQHLKSVRKYYLSLRDINTELAKIHKALHNKIELDRYQYATQYIHGYISHTTVWNLKFTMNLESPEVALLQILHLDYIFAHEDVAHFSKECTLFEIEKKRFYDLQPFSAEHIDMRRQKMLDYIEQQMLPRL